MITPTSTNPIPRSVDGTFRECPIGDSAKRGVPITGITCSDCPDYQECEPK